jgi:hypothetical protein
VNEWDRATMVRIERKLDLLLLVQEAAMAAAPPRPAGASPLPTDSRCMLCESPYRHIVTPEQTTHYACGCAPDHQFVFRIPSPVEEPPRRGPKGPPLPDPDDDDGDDAPVPQLSGPTRRPPFTRKPL